MVSISEGLCVVSQFSPGKCCHKDIAGSCLVMSITDGVVKEVNFNRKTCDCYFSQSTPFLTLASSHTHTPDHAVDLCIIIYSYSLHMQKALHDFHELIVHLFMCSPKSYFYVNQGQSYVCTTTCMYGTYMSKILAALCLFNVKQQ